SDEERAYCVEEFFHAHRPRMIDPFPRYAELLARRESHGAGLSVRSQASQFSTDDIRDLQVWHKLAWIDQYYFERDERVRSLVAGAGFQWMASDEEILAKSIGRDFGRDGEGHVGQPEALYRSYRIGREGQQVSCGFRDHTLSDLIGFSYASWPAEAAAENF